MVTTAKWLPMHWVFASSCISCWLQVSYLLPSCIRDRATIAQFSTWLTIQATFLGLRCQCEHNRLIQIPNCMWSTSRTRLTDSCMTVAHFWSIGNAIVPMNRITVHSQLFIAKLWYVLLRGHLPFFNYVRW